MYTDVLTRIRNAQAAKKDSLKVPFSNMDLVVLDLLAKYGYVASVNKKGRMPKRVIEVILKYDEKKSGAIKGVSHLSVPSRRIYAGAKELRPVKQGYGLGVVSTPKGIMAYHEAKKANMGGELLFEIW